MGTVLRKAAASSIQRFKGKGMNYVGEHFWQRI